MARTLAPKSQVRYHDATWIPAEENQLRAPKKVSQPDASISSGYRYYEVAISKENGIWGQGSFFKIGVGFSHGDGTEYLCELFFTFLEQRYIK